MMRPALALLPVIALAACDKPADKQTSQPGVVANINAPIEPAPEAPPPANVTAPTPSPDQATSGKIPIDLQGRWTGVSNRCGDRAADLELNILPDQLVFHESVGTVEAVTPGAKGEVAVKAAFTGEGQSWTRTLTLRPAADGATLTIVNDGTAVTRKRC